MKKKSFLILFIAIALFNACYSNYGIDNKKRGIIFFSGTLERGAQKIKGRKQTDFPRPVSQLVRLL
jgi:hypothetical protein